jgi:hypothetical protein
LTAAAEHLSVTEREEEDVKSKRLLLVFVVAVPVLAVTGYAIAGGLLDGAKKATAPFHNTDVARHAGYTVTVADTAGNVCIAEPGVGGMGVHLLNPKLLDTTIDPSQPEALVYREKANGALKLVALEYIVFKQAWEDAKGANAAPPSLFGRPFMLTPAPNRFGIPSFYALHAWAWKKNPSGTFQPWNPKVSCP